MKKLWTNIDWSSPVLGHRGLAVLATLTIGFALSFPAHRNFLLGAAFSFNLQLLIQLFFVKRVEMKRDPDASDTIQLGLSR